MIIEIDSRLYVFMNVDKNGANSLKKF